MAEVVRYVDPDATGAGDGTSWTDAYTSLSAWEAAEQTNLVTAGDWHHVYVRSSAGTADTTAVAISGWTTGASNYILIEAASGDEALKTGWDTSRYRLGVTNSHALAINDNHVQVVGLQIRVSRTSGFYYGGIEISGVEAGATITVAECWVDITVSSNAACHAIGINDSDVTVAVENCILTSDEGHTDYRGAIIAVQAASSASVYNSVLRGTSTCDGINVQSGATAVVKNNAIFGTGDDISNSGTITVQHNAADDDLDTEFTETTNIQPAGAWTAEFNDPANGDFTLLSGSNLVGAGIGPSADSNVPALDIDGDTRSGATCDIGVDEYVAAGGGTTPTGALSGPLVGALGGPIGD